MVRPNPAHVHPDWDLHAVTRKMTDFNLTVAPVMDEHHRMVGVITVDDVLETLLPTGWRRDFGMAIGRGLSDDHLRPGRSKGGTR